MKLIFLCADKHKHFLQVDSITWVCVARHSQSTQHDNFTISLHHLKENVKDKVDFLPADKHVRLLQSDTIILDVCGQASPNYQK